jgi:hypothetical protein
MSNTSISQNGFEYECVDDCILFDINHLIGMLFKYEKKNKGDIDFFYS